MSDLNLPEIYGEIGEYLTKKHLSLNMDAYVRADRTSFAGEYYLRREHSQDFDITNMHELATMCRMTKYCDIDEDMRPCLKEDFYKPNYEAISLMNYPDTGDDKFRWYCALRFTNLALTEYGKYSLSGSDRFISDYLICHYFIVNYHTKCVHDKSHNLLSDSDLKHFENKWKGRPGRLDYFAKSGDQYFCIDSKVNSSRLSFCQQIRMSWMTKCGHKAQIYNFNFTVPSKDEVKRIFIHDGIDSTIEYLKPTLNIIDYNPVQYPEAESFVSDSNRVISIARERLLGNCQ